MKKITTRASGLARGGTVLACVLTWAATGAGEPLEAQAVDVDFAVEQAVTTVDGMKTPFGYRVGLALPWMLGPVGFELGYRTVGEGLPSAPCGMEGCPASFADATMRMRAASVGVGLSRMLNPFVELTAGVTGSLTWQSTEYRFAEGAESEPLPSSSETAGPDFGLGAWTSWRFPPLLSALRPFLYARADWIGRGSCAADAPCFSHRYVASGGIGMYVRVP